MLAGQYPQKPSMSYISAVAWISTLRLAMITSNDAWRVKVRDQTHPWIAAGRVLPADQKQLTSLAGYMISATSPPDGNATARSLLLESAKLASERRPTASTQPARGWTDDLFMATAVLARTGDGHFLDLAARQLIAYAERLQRPDGVFMHAVGGPVAWGRGNGFAALGLMEALSAMPVPHPSRQQPARHLPHGRWPR